MVSPLINPPYLVAEEIDSAKDTLGFRLELPNPIPVDDDKKINLICGPGRPVQSTLTYDSRGVQGSIEMSLEAESEVRRNTLFVFGGSLINPTRFMGQYNEIRMEIIRTELRYTDYCSGYEKMIEVMNYLLGRKPSFTIPMGTGSNPEPSRDYEAVLDFYSTHSGPTVSGPDESNEFWFMANYMMKYIQPRASS